MSPETNESSTPNSPPDINKRFQTAFRDNRTAVRCPHCGWKGTNLARHALSEHGKNLTPQELAEAESTAVDDRPTRRPEETQASPMQVDEAPTSPVTPNSRPARRRHPGGTGRRVEPTFDPDFVRPRPERDNPSAPPRKLFDHRSDRTGQPTQPRAPRPQQTPTSVARNPQRPSQPQTPTRGSQVPPRTPQGPPPPTQPGLAIPRKQSTVAPSPNPNPPPSQQTLHDVDEPEPEPSLILQPETRPISQEQLVAEVKGIYAGLVMVEAKCIEVDSKQAAAATQGGLKEAPRLTNDQWQALIALHRTLLHEHHDFFLASQHPSAAPSLRKLATKYAMPARMWRHGIHSFLELLRHRLPDSFEHMLAFIYLAYSMMALLYETVPAFADTWVECLGDLGRYRMAIEEGDPRDREVWMNVSRFWYSKGTDRLPHVGRLYHHLAILARPNILQQLFFYCKALAVYQPFSAARESILTLFDPTALKEQDIEGNQSADATFVLLHSICFTFVNQDAFEMKKDEYLDLLEKKISATKAKFKIPGVYMAICGVASLFQYNMKDGRMKMATSGKENRKATDEAEAIYKASQMQKAEAVFKANLDPDTTIALPPGPVIDGYNPQEALATRPPELDPTVKYDISLNHAQDLAFSILSITLDRTNDASVQPHIHVWLVFLNYLKDYPDGMALIAKTFPWEQLAHYATVLLKKRKGDDNSLSRIHDSKVFPVVQKGFRPLPEEYMMRGLEIAHDDERHLELPSMNNVREEKMLWLLVRFARFGPWLKYDQARCSFTISAELKSLLHQYTRKPEYIQEPISTIDDSDVEMEMSPATLGEEDESFDEVENPELTQLLAQRRALRKQLNEPAISVEEEKKTKNASSSFSAASFKPNFTTVVVDTNSLVKNLDTFKQMLQGNQWSIVIPFSVVTELRGLQRNDGKISEMSEAALDIIQQALQEKRSLRVITAKGSQMNTISSQFYELIEDYSEDGRKNLDDIIIEIAKSQGEIAAKRLSNDGVTRPVVLITDDSVMRIKAITRGVASVPTKQWIKYISPVDEATARKIANTYHSLLTKHPKMDQDKVYQAARQAAGDESSAANILMSAKKRKAKSYVDRQQHQHGIEG
ncbi:hypothetical protein ABW19_dt0200002 [Dactylella cylindrospora]|nr:hypothetical protein ABW19_dt0200002 [Dactylella cylindrospora]